MTDFDDGVVVRRSAWRMWLTSLVTIPLVVLSVDILTQRRLTNALRDMIFKPDDTQLFEFRDVVWAWVILLAAGSVALWSLRELILPTKVIEADGAGIRLRINGPLKRPVFVAWSDVEDIGSATVDDEGDAFPVLWIRLADPAMGVEQPWSARWMDDQTMAIMASDWDIDPIEVARMLTDLAIEATRALADDGSEGRLDGSEEVT